MRKPKNTEWINKEGLTKDLIKWYELQGIKQVKKIKIATEALNEIITNDTIIHKEEMRSIAENALEEMQNEES